jgi:hypothetical protein
MPYLHLSSKGLAAKITTPPTVQWFLHAEVQPSSAIVGDDFVTPHPATLTINILPDSITTLVGIGALTKFD